VEDWEEHSPDVIQRILQGLATLRAEGRNGYAGTLAKLILERARLRT
jgi:hypothetical protein